METNVMHYRKIWEKHHGKTIPENHEIHHLDGNRSNNNIDNLICVSMEEHLEIHNKQGDHGAVLAILIRMKSKENPEIMEAVRHAASKFQTEKYENGTHNFHMSAEKRTKISKKTLRKRIKNHGTAFLGIHDTIANSKRAGDAAAAKKAGFLNTESELHGSKYVKNTCWWTNMDTGERVRRNISPGKKWKRGMKNA